ncbi:MAG: hypothetical protein IJR82_04370 [Bacilli bacterium]|nr:hypothetical protein [Bacilli bacterium]
MKKNLIVCLLVLVLIISGCGRVKDKEEDKKVDNTQDALKFKEEYESLNGVENNGNTIRTVNISKDNPFVYKEAGDIVEMMNDKETFIVYFGFSKCPWCRSMIETLIKVAKDYQIDTIYYVDVLEIRNILKLDDDEIITDREGTEDYLALIKLLDNVLSDYNLTDKDGNQVSTGEKRIYAPNVVSIVKGKATKLETGISENQESAYQELTDDMLEEEYDALANIMEEVSEKNVCDTNSKC